MMMKLQTSMMTLLAIIALIGLGSCSSGNAELYGLASADNDVIAAGNLKTVVENAKCTVGTNGIELSATVEKLLGSMSSRDRKDLKLALGLRGVDTEHSLFTVDGEQNALMAFLVTDNQKFQDYLDEISDGEIKFDEDKGYSYYSFDRRSAMFLRDNVAVIYTCRGKADVEAFEQYKEKAAKNPMLPWQKSALDRGNLFNMLINTKNMLEMMQAFYGTNLNAVASQWGYDYEELSNGYIQMNMSLKGVTATMEATPVSREGKALENKWAKYKVDTALMKYATAQDLMVVLSACPGDIDWSAQLEQMFDLLNSMGNLGLDQETRAIIVEVLSSIDGSVMVAAGPTQLNNIDNMRGWHGVLAAQLKGGKAAEYMGYLKAWVDNLNEQSVKMSQEYAQYGWTDHKPSLIECKEADGGLEITIPNEGKLYAQTDGNNLVISLSPITDNGGCLIGASQFKDACSGMIINVPRKNIFSTMMEMPFGAYLSIINNGQCTTMTVEETDVDGLFIDNILQFVAGQLR